MRTFNAALMSLTLCALAGSVGILRAEEPTVRVAEGEMKKAAVAKVNPDFPAMARQLRLSGRAEVDVYVSADGDVEKVQPLSGNPIFTGACVAAVKKWKFTPFKADGKPTKAVGSIGFDFR